MLRSQRLPLFIAALALIKIALLVTYGPAWLPGSNGYADYARRILASRDWLHTIDFASEALPVLAFRIGRYPARG